MQKLKPFASLASSHLTFNLQANISANSFLLKRQFGLIQVYIQI